MWYALHQVSHWVEFKALDEYVSEVFNRNYNWPQKYKAKLFMDFLQTIEFEASCLCRFSVDQVIIQ